jgi:hypothetical protein
MGHSSRAPGCGWCASKARIKTCGRCKQDGLTVTRSEDGPICRRCYVKDPLVVTERAGCGRMRALAIRREDGTALCSNCTPGSKPGCSMTASVLLTLYQQ